MVAAMHVFRARVAFDGHGDTQKVACNLNLLGFEFNAVLGVLPATSCLPPAPPFPNFGEGRQYMVEASILADNLITDVDYSRALGKYIFEQLDGTLVGNVQRFSQLQTETGGVGDGFGQGTAQFGAELLGSISIGIEASVFDRKARPGIISLNGTGFPSYGIDSGQVEPCYLEDSICTLKAALDAFLNGCLEIVDKRIPLEYRGFCKVEYVHNLIGSLPSDLGWGELGLGFDETFVVPSAGQFGVPTYLSSACPKDP
eukprot:CAMPEP_0118716622 /NCGR_PEP_ID=MMETSP0800-20121206/27600_1 /TAXON_ID=210618 ORGANISM="Striatella unipunctata, Strain CCMP2910" /NCGR_SAMPLE_ID=MMETSP0800 /ASSEMBLY_ACC=CAM_ASM_000638 /LENGTH=256 /DNA_ID=CAMNT_0006623057 /DNA_START=198 /DNA_END=968 /DNA_ORIENTATION=-